MPDLPVRAFIFDLDGVLTDTAEYHFLAWKRLADEEGLPFTREDNEALRGLSRRESLRHLLKGRRIPKAQAQAWMARKNRYYQEMIAHITPEDVLPGVLRLLNEVRQAGMKIAVASASKNAAAVIERLGLFPLIDVLCDGHSVTRPKPAPDLFLFAAQNLDTSPSHCVVVEDAQAGIEAALAAGMWAVAIGPPARFQGAHLLFPSLAGLRLSEILQRLQSITSAS